MTIFHSEKADHNVIWRGQRDPSWSLEPTMMRLQRRKKTKAKLPNIEQCLKVSFSRGAAYFPELERLGENEDFLWAFGQHNGLATPLLDWSYSPYVALFFCFADLVMNVDEKDWTTTVALYSLDLGIAERLNLVHEESRVEFKSVRPGTYVNRRLLAQQGVLTLTNPSIALDQLLKSNPRFADIVRKFEFRKTGVRSGLVHLNRMNINYRTLFPDAIGACLHANLAALVPGYEAESPISSSSSSKTLWESLKPFFEPELP